MFDEATENAIWMFLEELMEAIRDEKLTFFEGCEIIIAPIGAPPEYITVQVDDIYDENVLWRGIPPTLGVGDIVVVWENPISHRREILGAGGAGGVGLLHDLLSATHGDTTPGAVVQGDLIVGDGIPSWANLAIGTPDQLLTVNAAGTDPVWASNLRQILELEFNDAALLTIAAGTVTRTQVYHVIAAQVGVADDLDNVLGGVEGDELVIRCDAGDTITVRHNQGGAGDFWFAGGANIALDNEDHLRFICDANGRWCDQSGGAGALAVHDHSGILQGGQDLHDIQELEFAGIINLTIVAGAVTRTQVYHAIIPEGGLADDLETINGGVEGDLLIIRRADAQPAVTVKHNVGNIWILSNQDVLLDDVDDHLALIYDGGYWCDVGGAGAGGGSLDDAYNVGRIIVADAGTVVIQDIGGLSVDSLIESTRTGAAPAAQHTVVDGAGNAVTEVLRLIHNLNVGFGAAGMGARILFRLVDDGGDIEDAAALDAIWTNPADGSETSNLEFPLRNAGAAPASPITLTPSALLGKGSVYPNLGSTTIAEKWGNIYQASGKATSGDTFADIVKNTSGGAVVAGDVGYIDSAGEFKTTTTAYLDVAWGVVLIGGANNADIYVARRGRVIVTLNGNCSAGDYLYTSTTAGQAQPQSYTRPELFAVALTANAGGAGGTCSARLLCNTRFLPTTSSIDIFSVSGSSDTDWRTTINGAPAGAVVTYTAPLISGAEDCIDPTAANLLGKLRLYNETRGDYALIDDVNQAANTITLTANAPGAWANGDTITVRSQTCTAPAPPPYCFDIDLSDADNTVIPKTARAIEVEVATRDTGAAGGYTYTHPWEAYAGAKVRSTPHYAVNIFTYHTKTVPLIQRRFCTLLNASGAATSNQYYRLTGIWQAEP